MSSTVQPHPVHPRTVQPPELGSGHQTTTHPRYNSGFNVQFSGTSGLTTALPRRYAAAESCASLEFTCSGRGTLSGHLAHRPNCVQGLYGVAGLEFCTGHDWMPPHCQRAAAPVWDPEDPMDRPHIKSKPWIQAQRAQQSRLQCPAVASTAAAVNFMDAMSRKLSSESHQPLLDELHR